MKKVVIVDAVRTPIGRYKGALSAVRPDDLAAVVLKALMNRNPRVNASQIEDVIFGCANQAGEDNRNVARMAVLLSGMPIEVGGVTVNRLCGSGLEAVNQAARAIAADEGDIYIAGGTESMTRAPFVMGKPEDDYPRGDMKMFDTTIGWRFINKKLENEYGVSTMPQTAQIVADRYGITREEQDIFAYASQQKVKRARDKDLFKDEIVAVDDFEQDEHPRPDTSLEKLAKLKPLFENGSVTAGNAAGINDGAAALLLMSEEKARELNITPMAYYVTSAVSGLEPDIMGLGPIEASRKALKRAGISVEDIDLIELNEAFASQALACMKQLELPSDKVNVNGGSIALGHPLGASGARILTTLLHEMKRRDAKHGLATMCIGVGQGIATIVERYG